jgi:hypothetical protein
MHAALAAAATLVALAFGAATFERFLDRRASSGSAARSSAPELAWSASLVIFAVASIGLWTGASIGWNPTSFRVFYGCGAIVVVPVLALGTVYLLAGRIAGHVSAVAVALLGAWALGVMTTVGVDPAVRSYGTGDIPRGSDVLGALPRALAAVGSGLGATVLLAGAVVSAVRLARRRTTRRLAMANALIALGTLILSVGGLFNSALGEMDAFSLSLVAGIAVMFGGFLLTAPTAKTQAGGEKPGTDTREATSGERANIVSIRRSS